MRKLGIRIASIYIVSAACIVGFSDHSSALAHGESEPESWTLAADRAHARMIAFSPTGSRLAVAGRDSFIRVVDTYSGKILLSHDQQVSPTLDFSNCVAFSNEGKLIASARGEKGVELWDAATGETMGQFELPQEKQETVSPIGKHYTLDLGVCPIIGAFSRDGRLLAVEAANQLALFDIVAGKRRLSLAYPDADGGGLPARSPPVLALGGELAPNGFSGHDG